MLKTHVISIYDIYKTVPNIQTLEPRPLQKLKKTFIKYSERFKIECTLACFILKSSLNLVKKYISDILDLEETDTTPRIIGPILEKFCRIIIFFNLASQTPFFFHLSLELLRK